MPVAHGQGVWLSGRNRSSDLRRARQGAEYMTKAEVRARIQAIGIIPAVRVYSAEDARFAAEAVSQGGIPIVEITMTVPGALHVISDLVRHAPETLVGAGSVPDAETA